MLICPKCKQKLKTQNELSIINNSYKCDKGHTYDISKEGYANLLDSKTGSGDNDILIKAREKFLSKCYYDKLKEAIGFAYLGYFTFMKKSNNVPSCTGADKDVVMGKISY